MADPSNMTLLENIPIAIQLTKSHIAYLNACLVEAEKYTRALESMLEVTDAQKSSDPLSQDKRTNLIAYNLAIQLQLINEKLKGLSSDKVEGEIAMARLYETIRETVEEYIKSSLPHTPTIAYSSTPKPNRAWRLSEDINSFNLETASAKDGACQTIVRTSEGQFEMGNVESTGRSNQFVGSTLNMDSWISRHYGS
ncbi:hypothetical protein BDV06DRAFT_203203 [Aspergillus oleicola]